MSSVLKAQEIEYVDHAVHMGKEYRLAEEKIILKKGEKFYYLFNGVVEREILFKKVKLSNGRSGYYPYIEEEDSAEIRLMLLPPATKPYTVYRSLKKDGSTSELRVYDIKKTKEGRIVSEKEFQSYRGLYTYHTRIKGGDFAKDTLIISPPTKAQIKKSEDELIALYDLAGSPVPEFSFTTMNGRSLSLNELKGKVIVLNFWFRGCPPCIEEMPILNELTEFYKSKDIEFIAFGLDDKETISKFLSTKEFKYQQVPSALEIAEQQFKVYTYPTQVIIDKNGIVLTVIPETKTLEEFKSIINPLLEE